MNIKSLLPFGDGFFSKKGDLHLMERLKSEVNKVIDNLHLDHFWGAGAVKMDVWRTSKTLFVSLEVPGMSLEDLAVSISGRWLVIQGEKKILHNEKKEDVYMEERYFGKFERVVLLPSDVAPEDVQATLVDGVLEIQIPSHISQHEGQSQIPINVRN